MDETILFPWVLKLVIEKTCWRGGPNMRDMHTPPLEGSILTEQGLLGPCQHLEQKLSCHLPEI